ncbi:hypothetical protein ACROYT_G035592 [Oculina patagonica]
MARASPYLPTDRQSDYALLAFPEKLWWIVNNPKHEEIHWNALGTGIVIPSIQRFVSEILNNPSSALFKTKHFASFVRQLNLYGFRKVTEYPKRTPSSPLSFFSKCEFKHPYFRKGRRDLLLHVKRQLYSVKKPERRRQKSHTPSAMGRPFDQPPGPASLGATAWNPTLYTPMPLVPWQTSLQMPLTLYAPFCNAYQLAQMQQGPVGSLPSVQGLGLPGQIKQSSTSPSMMWTQSLGSHEGNVKSVSCPAPIRHETMTSQESLPVEAVESLNSLHSPPTIKSTATAIPITTPNAVVLNNAPHPTAIPETESNARHNGFLPGNSCGALDATLNSSVPNNNPELSQKTTHSPRKQSAEPSVSFSQSFTVHALLKKSAEKPFDSGSQSFTVDALVRESIVKPSASVSQPFTKKEIGEGSVSDGEVRNAQELCSSRGIPLSCVRFQNEYANAAKLL